MSLRFNLSRRNYRKERHVIRRFTIVCVSVALCAAGVTQLFAAGPQTNAATKAIVYVEGLQNTDGGFPDFAAASSPSATIEAEFAFAAVGVNPATIRKGGMSPADYLATQAVSYSGTPGGAAKLVIGIAMMDLDATSFGSIDALAAMEASYNTGTGQFGSDLFAQSLYMLAERSLARPVPPLAVTYLEAQQHVDGGWEDCCGFGEDTDTTALVMRALIASGVPAADTHIVKGLAYLKASQQSDGGFPYSAPGASDPDSTAYSLQAIVAAGENINAGGPWDAGAGKTPLTALASLQNPANGALQYFGSDSAFATYQGVPGLMLSAFPEQQLYGPARDHKTDANGDGYSAADETTIANCGAASCGGFLTFATAESRTCKDAGRQCGVPNPPSDETGPARVAPPPATGYGCSVTLDTTGPLSTKDLARADVDLDGVVSILDLAKVATWFGNTIDANVSDPRWEGNMDGDNAISILDLAAMAANFTRSVANNCKVE